MKIKRIVIGDFIQSKKDNETHYISANALCSLYEFNVQECFLVEDDDKKQLLGLPSTLPRFYPRFDGNYSNKEETK